MPDQKRTVKIGEIVVTVTDPDNVRPVLVETIMEARIWSGVIAIALGTISNEGDNGEPEARVCARLRLPLPTAKMLSDMLAQMVSDATATPEKQTLN